MKIKLKHFITMIIILAVLVVIIITLSHPLRKAEDRIKEDMLELTPVGLDMAEVIEIVKGEGWNLDWVDNSYGYGISHAGVPGEGTGYSEVGVESIRISDEYGILFLKHTYVVVYYGFDENSELIDIAVRKGLNV